jgi:hypothetical protein
MQALNCTMGLSHAITHADVVLLFPSPPASASAAIGASARGGGGGGSTSAAAAQTGTGFHQVNARIAAAVVANLWPLQASDPAAGRGRLRALAASVCCDPCLRMAEAHAGSAGSGSSLGPAAVQWTERARWMGAWRDAGWAGWARCDAAGGQLLHVRPPTVACAMLPGGGGG